MFYHYFTFFGKRFSYRGQNYNPKPSMRSQVQVWNVHMSWKLGIATRAKRSAVIDKGVDLKHIRPTRLSDGSLLLVFAYGYKHRQHASHLCVAYCLYSGPQGLRINQTKIPFLDANEWNKKKHSAGNGYRFVRRIQYHSLIYWLLLTALPPFYLCLPFTFFFPNPSRIIQGRSLRGWMSSSL